MASFTSAKSLTVSKEFLWIRNIPRCGRRRNTHTARPELDRNREQRRTIRSISDDPHRHSSFSSAGHHRAQQQRPDRAEVMALALRRQQLVRLDRRCGQRHGALRSEVRQQRQRPTGRRERAGASGFDMSAAVIQRRITPRTYLAALAPRKPFVLDEGLIFFVEFIADSKRQALRRVRRNFPSFICTSFELKRSRA